MASSFFKTAQKSVKDVQQFLKESAGGNSVKYSIEVGKKHHILFPAVPQESVDESGNAVQILGLNAIQMDVHEWNTSDNKYRACACLKDNIRKDDDGNILNDGSCPFCEREQDAWSIYNIRKEDAEKSCVLPAGKSREEYLKNVLTGYRNDMKAKKAKPYMYVVAALFKTDANDQPIIDEKTQLPAYEIKVMKLGASRVEKINKVVVNSGLVLPGTEIIIDYPAGDDKMRSSLDATFTVPFPGTSIKDKFPAVVEKITADAAAFDWDGIEKTFTELAGMTTLEAKNITDSLFEQWDKYQLELKTNPNAKYLEYVVETSQTQPDIAGAVANAGTGAAQIGTTQTPTMPNVGTTQTPTMPNVGATQAPTMPNLDVQTPTMPNVGNPTMTDVTPNNTVLPDAQAAQANANAVNNVFTQGGQTPTLSI